MVPPSITFDPTRDTSHHGSAYRSRKPATPTPAPTQRAPQYPHYDPRHHIASFCLAAFAGSVTVTLYWFEYRPRYVQCTSFLVTALLILWSRHIAHTTRQHGWIREAGREDYTWKGPGPIPRDCTPRSIRDGHIRATLIGRLYAGLAFVLGTLLTTILVVGGREARMYALIVMLAVVVLEWLLIVRADVRLVA